MGLRASGGRISSRYRGPYCIIPPISSVTHIIQAIQGGEAKAADELLPLVYEELRKLAAFKLAQQSPDQTLQPTALVHEAYLRLLGDGNHSWQDRRHFFAAAAEAMRHILVDRARRKASVRHGGGLQRIDLDCVVVAAGTTDENILLINEALEKLATHDPDAAELVKLRFFAGLTFPQAAEVLGQSERSAKRLWAYARAWLFKEIQRL
jgi:RNA polymerase sigma factor (TIGR02999 family)